MRRALLSFALLFIASAASAQTGLPVSYTFTAYNFGNTAPQSPPRTVLAAQVVCNQIPFPTTASNVNPDVWTWDDPDLSHSANGQRVCIYNDVTFFNALANGDYEGTIHATNADGTSMETMRFPFVRTRVNPPGVPTNPRAIRSGP